MTPLRTLHILNKPPEHSRHRLCLSAVAPGDGLLLIENGVLAAAKVTEGTSCQWFALSPDLQARGVSVQTGIEPISFEEMVELTASAGHVVSW